MSSHRQAHAPLLKLSGLHAGGGRCDEAGRRRHDLGNRVGLGLNLRSIGGLRVDAISPPERTTQHTHTTTSLEFGHKEGLGLRGKGGRREKERLIDHCICAPGLEIFIFQRPGRSGWPDRFPFSLCDVVQYDIYLMSLG